jgi:NTP pyrophosphatase (non-canonical NTP hydrolase)
LLLGELFKAIRKQAGMPIDANSRVRNVDEELADVLIYVCAMANRFGIDLETAFREKEDLNKNRQWQASSEN